MRTQKKLVSALLALALAFSLLPTAVLAADEVTLLVNQDAVYDSAPDRAPGATYCTIADALGKAASGDTIQLQTDVSESVSIASSQDITLDLADCTLTGTVTNEGTLTVMDSLGDGGITSETYAINNKGTLKVYSGHFIGSSASLKRTSGTVSVYGGTFNKAVSSTMWAVGYCCVKNEDGTYAVTGPHALYVKKSSQTAVEYAGSSLTTAMEYTEGSGITLTFLDDFTENMTVPSTATGLTLDLNGHTLTGSITNYGVLTVKDGKATSSSLNAISEVTLASESAKLTVYNATTCPVTTRKAPGAEYYLSKSGTTTKPVYTVKKYSVKIDVQDGNVATTSYKNKLSDAVTVAGTDPARITLLKNHDISSGGLTIPAGADITLDLNGYTLTADNITGSNLAVASGATLHLTDSTDTARDGTGSGAVTYNGTGADGLIHVEGTFSMDSGLISAPVMPWRAGIGVWGSGTVTITGGKIDVGTYAIAGNGSDTTADASITVSGGTLISKNDYAIYHPHGGTLTIAGTADIQGAAGGIAANNGTVNISGGRITSLGTLADIGEGSTGTNGLENAALNLAARYGDVTVTITGGEFDAQNDAALIDTSEMTSHSRSVTITGGTYSSDPTCYVAPGYAAALNEDNKYVVGPAHTVTVDGGSAAPASAPAGVVITLTAGTAPAYTQFSGWTVTSGDVTVTDNKFTMPDTDVAVKADFEHVHSAASAWEYDDAQHWHACQDETCDEKLDTADHVWVKDEAASTLAVYVYKCACGAEKNVDADKLVITVTKEGQGTVEPSGLVEVTPGEDQTFTFTPAQGYELVKVQVDGGDVDADDYYTFESVTDDHTLDVVFGLNYPIQIIGPTGEMNSYIGEDSGNLVIQGSTGDLYDPHDDPNAASQLTYWVYNGWLFTAVSTGPDGTTTYGPAKTIDGGLTAFLREAIAEGKTLTMDSKSVGSYNYPSSGGSSSGSSSSTTTEKNPDGSTTTTTTDKATGTVTEVTKETDGTTTTVVTTKDGAVTETVKTPEGTTGTVVTDKNGEVTEVTASVSNKAANEAAKTGDAVTLPVEVPAAKNTEDAPAVQVTVPKSADSVKVEIPVEKVTPGTVAVIMKADGTEEIVSTSVVTENGVVLTLDGSATVKVIDNSKDFVDVPETNVFYNEISSLSAREIMVGKTEDFFDLHNDVTLNQVANVAGRITGAVDVKDFNAGIVWGNENGLKTGNEAATRGEVLKALYVAAGSPAVADTSIVARFNDAANIPADMAAIVAWAAQNGILKGTDAGNADLNAYVTRGQACALASRTMGTLA